MKIKSTLLVGIVALVAACTAVLLPANYYSGAASLGSASRVFCSAGHIGDGVFLTAAHCITSEDADYRVDGEPATFLYSDRYRDVGFVYVPTLAGIKSNPIRCTVPRVGSNIIHVGQPVGMSDVHTFGKIASDVRGFTLWPYAMLLDIVGAPGSSGAPLYNAQDEIVAVMVGGFSPFGGMMVGVSGKEICKVKKAMENFYK